MKKFIVLYHASADAMKEIMNATPEQQKAGMDGWMHWAAKCGDKLVDMGSPLMGGQTISRDGKTKNSTKEVTGYSVLRATDMNEAKSLLEGHPHLAYNAACSIEVHENMPLAGM